MRILSVLLSATFLVCGTAVSAGTTAAPNSAWSTALAGPPEGVIAQLSPYVSAHPDDTAAARALGDAYFRAGNVEQAEATWLAASKRRPEDRETHERLGRLYVARGRIKEALNQFELSFPLRDALRELVELHTRTNTLKAFLIQTQQQVADNVDDPEQYLLYAIVLQDARRVADALPYYTRAVVMARGSDRCYAEIGRSLDYIELQRRNDAVSDLEECLHGDPDNYTALAVMGSIDVDAGKYGEARHLFQHALTVQPDGVDALIDLGYLDDAAGNTASARARYQEAIAIDPLRPEGYVNLGYDDVAQHKYSSAEAVLRAGLTAVPDNGRLHYLLGEAYRGDDKVEQAQAEFQAALSSDEPAVVTAARTALAMLRILSDTAGERG